jgi:hypothetical protein
VQRRVYLLIGRKPFGIRNSFIKDCKGNIIVKVIEVSIHKAEAIRHIAIECIFIGDEHRIANRGDINFRICPGGIL